MSKKSSLDFMLKRAAGEVGVHLLSRFWWGLLSCLVVEANVSGAEPERVRLEQHVTTLASPPYAGRRGPGAELARRYVLDELRTLPVKPLFGDSYSQTVTGADAEEVLGVNVGVKLEPTDPKFAGQWIILGTHYDHLGVVNGVTYPGADDNASGVAMMLEVARTVAQTPGLARRGIIFVGFDLEERGANGEFGLRGSQFFANHPPVPLEQVRLFLTADMIGRSLGGVCHPDVFVLGSEHEPGVRPWIETAAMGQPVRVNLLGSDVLVIDRSDYGPFRTRQIPYLFFTTGENPLYHSPKDLAATINYEKLTAISRVVAKVVLSAAQADSMPGWAAEPDYPVAEAVAFHQVFQTLLAHRADLKIGVYPVLLLEQGLKTTEKVVARGTMTAAERNSIVRVAQLVLFSVF